MEFVDPIVAEPETKPIPHEEGKTEQVVNQLESEIDKAYTSVEKRFGELWTAASKNAENLQEKYHLEQRRDEILKQLTAARDNIDDKAKVTEHLNQFEQQIKSFGGQLTGQIHIPEINLKTLGDKANTYLDELDSRLEIVESQAGKYVSQFTSFLSGIVQVNTGTPQAEEETKKETTTVFAALGTNPNYGTSRYDSDLYKLHTTPGMILNEKLDGEDLKQFDVDSKTKIISSTLEKYDNTLRKLMNDLVPVKIPYNVFWYRYFKLETDLKSQEEQRKKLLENKEPKKDDDDDDDFTWDDDEDDEEPVDVGKEAQGLSK